MRNELGHNHLSLLPGCIATIPIGMQEFMLVFLAFNPGWKCEVGSTTCLHNGTILPTDPMYKDRCTMNRTDWNYIDTKGFSIVNEVSFSLILNGKCMIIWKNRIEDRGTEEMIKKILYGTRR